MIVDSVESTGQILPGSVATYICNTNHQLRGSPTSECQNDGTWSESEPTCESTQT